MPLLYLPKSPSAIQIVAMVSVQLENGIPEEEIRKSLDLDDKFDVDIPLYIEFCVENEIVVKDDESGKYKITNYGREFIAAFLPPMPKDSKGLILTFAEPRVFKEPSDPILI